MPRRPDGKRKTYTIKFKLDVIKEYAPGDGKMGFDRLAKKFSVPKTSVRLWWHHRERLKSMLRDDKVQTRKARRLHGGGRKPLFADMEKDLHQWILDRNEKGLRVKDHYISKMALQLHEDAQGDDEEGSIPFKASTGWLDRFKQRFDLVSRRHTIDRKIPLDAPDVCRAFIMEVQQLIDTHKIKPKNVINMDQVPRYFETEPQSTICTRGSRTVKMTKGGTSHKRFTIAFSITGADKHLKPHILISKRKNKPDVPPGIDVDVNHTGNAGMWSEQICWEHFQETVVRRVETQFFREPTLYLIDAYGAHKNWANAHAKYLHDMNVFVRIVPANLTSLLQPLDVAVNRSYQADYGTKHDAYIAEALRNPTMQTKAGNPKVPTVKMVSTWALDWISTCKEEDIAKAFKVCGLVPSSEFAVDALHPPLRVLFAEDIDFAEWNAQYSRLLDIGDESRPTMFVEPPEWFCPDFEYSLFKCLLRSKGLIGAILDESLDAYIMDIVVHMGTLWELEDIFDDAEAANILMGEMDCPTLLVYAASHFEKWEVKLSIVNH